MKLRDKIVREIMTLVRPEPVEMKPKPTIEELEKILNSEDPREIDIRPDGSIYSRPPSHTTVGDVADAILRVVKDWYEREGDDPNETETPLKGPTNEEG